MDSGLYRIEATGLAGLAKLPGLPGLGGDFSGRPATAPVNTFTPRFVGVLAVLIAGLGAWVLLSGYASNKAEGEPVHLVTATATEPVQPSVPGNAEEGSLPQSGGNRPSRSGSPRSGARQRAEDFVAVLAEGRLGVEGPSHAYAPQRQ